VPPLPSAVEVAPTDVPWGSGATVQLAGEEGANLRPYPVADDAVAAPITAVAPDATIQIVSSFRLDLPDGRWWYVQVQQGADPTVPPVFGWLREDLLQASSGEALAAP